MYQPGLGFRAYPTQDTAGGNDYCNYYMDDAGKMLMAFSQLNDSTYANRAANFIIDNAITESGYTYLPSRIVGGCSTYLHVNDSSLASPTYNITTNLVQNPSFETINSSSSLPSNWILSEATGTTGGLTSNAATDGIYSVYATTSGNAGASAFYQNISAQDIVIFAHYDPAAPVNGGIVGNYTASYSTTSRTTQSTSVSSTNPFTWSFYGYPTLTSEIIVPANSQISLGASVSANTTLTGVTLSGRLNETCSGYSVESSPWGAAVSTTVNLTTTPTLYKITVPTGSSPVAVASGCAFHPVFTVNTNTAHPYTITFSFDSQTNEAVAKIPISPTLGELGGTQNAVGFAVERRTNSSSGGGYFVAIVTSGGTILFENGTVTSTDVPHVIGSPVVETRSFDLPYESINQQYGTAVYNYASLNFNMSQVLKSNIIPLSSVVNYVEVGVDTSSAGANFSAYFDSLFVIDNLGAANSPNPGPGVYMPGGYWYASNGILGLTNHSALAGLGVYEQSISIGVVSQDENATNFHLTSNFTSIKQQENTVSGSAPYATDLLLWDIHTNATGTNSRIIFPYSLYIGFAPYKLYLSGGNGSAIHIDEWMGIDTQDSLYSWFNITLGFGQDYVNPQYQVYDLGYSPVQIDDVNWGFGDFNLFTPYIPWWAWMKMANGNVVSETFNNTNPAITNSHVYNSTIAGSSYMTSMYWTGFTNPEFATGFLIQPSEPQNLTEIDYVYNFFGQSLRFVQQNNWGSGSGALNAFGGTSHLFGYDMVLQSGSDWTMPDQMLGLLPTALATNGTDVSMSVSWGIPTYALALWGQKTNNATILNFARELWNSQYQDAEQRANPNPIYYDPTAQPYIYFRALYAFMSAGFLLYPGNQTVTQFGITIAHTTIGNQISSSGDIFGIGESGWGGLFLSLLRQATGVSSQDQVLYDSYIAQIEKNLYGNTTYVPVTTWPYSFSSTDSPAVWNNNKQGTGVNAYCNSPSQVFNCGEMLYGLNEPTGGPDANFVSNWNSSAALASASLIWELSNLQSSGMAVDVNYFPYSTGPSSGNSNTETQPESVVGLLAWMSAMQTSTGTYVSSLKGAGISSITVNPFYGNGYDAVIINLNIPAGKTANMTFNVGTHGAPALVTDNGTPVNYAYDSATGDIILTKVASTIVFGFQNSVGSKQSSSGSCTSSGAPSISITPIYAQIGKTTTKQAQIDNSNNNASETVTGVTFSAPAGILLGTQSGIPQTVNPYSTGTFLISVSVPNSTQPGEYKVTATAPFTETCGANTNPGEIGFTVQVIAQLGSGGPPPWWLAFLETWWWALVIAIIIVIGGVVIAVKRNQDEW